MPDSDPDRITADEIIALCVAVNLLPGPLWIGFAPLAPAPGRWLEVTLTGSDGQPAELWVISSRHEPGLFHCGAGLAAKRAMLWLYLRWRDEVSASPDLLGRQRLEQEVRFAAGVEIEER
jgi:hypothetical protein